MVMNDKKLQVSAIKDGTVIDHIPASGLFNVINILRLDKIEKQITFGTNLESKRLGLKAIIKLADIFFVDNDINKNYEVVEKKLVEVPDTIKGIAKCGNPKCITNHERIKTKFTVVNKKKVAIKCHYCEKITDSAHMEIF
jgi:aspartate carbamoyltransferase regulatory subunit